MVGRVGMVGLGADDRREVPGLGWTAGTMVQLMVACTCGTGGVLRRGLLDAGRLCPTGVSI